MIKRRSHREGQDVDPPCLPERSSRTAVRVLVSVCSMGGSTARPYQPLGATQVRVEEAPGLSQAGYHPPCPMGRLLSTTQQRPSK